jgi:peptidoglycan/xylan/chitin deacetylase (PgdA/CDA1 family)
MIALLPTAATASPQVPQKTDKQQSKVVYLTFDDGPNAVNSPRLLKVLAKEQIPATFFVVGQYLAAEPHYASRLVLAGHAVGNHTWSHADLTHLPVAQIAHQLRSTQNLMGPVGGRCMRPPYGATNSTVAAVTASMGLAPVMWTVDPQDWAHQDAGYIAGSVLNQVRNRSVVLLHDGGGPRSATIAAVKTIIAMLRLRGYEFRTVPSCRVTLSGEVLNAARKLPRPVMPDVPEASQSPAQELVPSPQSARRTALGHAGAEMAQ